MRYVAIAPHPDDVELMVGGTLLRLADAGEHELTVVVVTDGSKGSADGRSEAEICVVREAEARAAAALMGAEFRGLGFVDGELIDRQEVRAAITSELRRARAEVVITTPLDDYNADHLGVGEAVTAACVWAAAPGIAAGGEPLSDTPALLYADPIGGGGAQPTHYVDISDVFERKLELLACHASQIALAEAAFGMTLLEIARITGAWRGLQSRVRYAEGFTLSSSYPRRRAGAFLP